MYTVCMHIATVLLHSFLDLKISRSLPVLLSDHSNILCRTFCGYLIILHCILHFMTSVPFQTEQVLVAMEHGILFTNGLYAIWDAWHLDFIAISTIRTGENENALVVLEY